MKFDENRIERLYRVGGKLPAYIWPGGYPLYYIAAETGEVFCTECANQQDAEPEITHYDVNWEDGELFCCGCGQRIESAYAEEPPDESR